MLNDKDRDILRTIIDVYVGDGVPVSSQRVRDAGRFRMSTATIRNRMVVLERDGYVMKAHVSAGRIPTDEGYRTHVDELLADCAWLGADTIPGVREGLRGDVRDVNALLQFVSQQLGTLSNHVAVVYGSIVPDSRVHSLRLFGVEGGRVLVVVRLTPGHERTVNARPARAVAPEALQAAESLLNRMLAGCTPDEARRLLAEALRDNVTDEGIVLGAVAERRDELFSEPAAIELWLEERSRVLEQPELSDPRNLQLLLRILHDRDYLSSILAARPIDRTEVTIGGEHGDDALRPFSVVTAGYRVGAARGVLGLIGPTRMRYDTALSVVGAMAREVCAIDDEYF